MKDKLVIVELQEGSEEWRALRRTKRTASETPAIMGTSKWQKPADVFAEKQGTREHRDNPAQRHGRELEAAARAALEVKLGLIGSKAVGYRGDYLASLDCWGHIDGSESFNYDIKCPFSGVKGDTWKAALKGEIEPGYADQLEHQHRVFGTDINGLFVYLDDERNLLVPYKPNDQRWGEIQRAWDSFWETCIKTGISPSEYAERDDKDWLQAAYDVTHAVREREDAEATEKAAKERLKKLAAGRSSAGGGVRVNFYVKSGSIDYRAALSKAAPDFDPEPFRKAPTEEARVEIIKQESK